MNEITKELLEALKGCERIMSCFELDGFETKAARAAIAKAEAALAEPQADADGWIPWSGGECPVPTGTVVDVKYRNGSIGVSLPANISHYFVNADAGFPFWVAHGLSKDIIAYRIAKGADK